MSVTKVTTDLITSLDSAKLTGSVDVARLPSTVLNSNVPTQDTSKIENDIAILALHQAINENKSAYSLANSWIEQFENSTYITGLTNVLRDATEYVSSASTSTSVGAFPNDANTLLLIHSDTTHNSTTFTDSSSNGHTITHAGNARHRSNANITEGAKFGASSIFFDGVGDSFFLPDHANWDFGTGDFTIESWVSIQVLATNFPLLYSTGAWGTNNYDMTIRANTSNYEIALYNGSGGPTGTITRTLPTTSWHHYAVSRTSGVMKVFYDGAEETVAASAGFQGNENVTNGSNTPKIADNTWAAGHMYIDEYRISNVGRYTSNFTPNENTVVTVQATGSFTSTTVAPQDGAAKTSVGLVLLYKNNAGTNTLNTDIICRVSANNGTTYTACVLAAKGTFSTGILIAVAPAVAVTSGTQLKYKVEFANQASGSKEARVHGVAMTY